MEVIPDRDRRRLHFAFWRLMLTVLPFLRRRNMLRLARFLERAHSLGKPGRPRK